MKTISWLGSVMTEGGILIFIWFSRVERGKQTRVREILGILNFGIMQVSLEQFQELKKLERGSIE